MRLLLVFLAVGAFGALGIRDMLAGSIPVGFASVLLATANGILLTR